MSEKAKPVSAITVDDIPAINAVLAKGYCVELRPVKSGVKAIQVIRQQVTDKQNKAPSP